MLTYVYNHSGLAAWIVEKFKTWSDCHGDVETCFTKDELLTNICIYWWGSVTFLYFFDVAHLWHFLATHAHMDTSRILDGMHAETCLIRDHCPTHSLFCHDLLT